MFSASPPVKPRDSSMTSMISGGVQPEPTNAERAKSLWVGITDAANTWKGCHLQ